MKIIKVLFILLVIISIKANAQKTDTSISENPNVVVTFADVMPFYPGGEEAMYKFIGNNIKYPNIAREKEITGTVIVTFVVEEDGAISGVQLLKGIGEGCDEEALRVVKSMPKWIPAKQNGVNVKCRFNLPIRFTIDKVNGEYPSYKKHK